MKKVLFFIVMCAISMVFAQSARAAGIGVYGTGGAAFMNWKNEGDKYGSSTDYFYGGGIIVDSNVAKDQLFGYRFSAGYEQYVLTDPGSSNTSDPIHRFSMSHTFGFGMVRTDMVRLWAGPRLGLHYHYLHKAGYELDAIGADALLAFGLNINPGNIFTLFFDVGFGYMGFYTIKSKVTSADIFGYTPKEMRPMGHSFGIDAKIGFMFRINDTYKQTASTGDIKMQVQEK